MPQEHQSSRPITKGRNIEKTLSACPEEWVIDLDRLCLSTVQTRIDTGMKCVCNTIRTEMTTFTSSSYRVVLLQVMDPIKDSRKPSDLRP